MIYRADEMDKLYEQVNKGNLTIREMLFHASKLDVDFEAGNVKKVVPRSEWEKKHGGSHDDALEISSDFEELAESREEPEGSEGTESLSDMLGTLDGDAPATQSKDEVKPET